MSSSGSTFCLGNTDWSKDTEAETAIRRFYEQRYLKASLEARAARNAAFMDGKQLYDWNAIDRQMRLRTKVSQSPDLMTYPVIRSLCEQAIAKILGSTEPVWTAPALPSDARDQLVSRFSNDLLGHLYTYDIRMPRVIERMLRKFMSSPVVWLEPTWDPLAGGKQEVQLDDFLRQGDEIPDNASPEERERIEALNSARADEDIKEFRNLDGFKNDNKPVSQREGAVRVNIRTIFNTMWYPFYVEDYNTEVHAYLVSEVQSPEVVAARYDIPLKEVLRHRGGVLGNDRSYGEILAAYRSPFIAGEMMRRQDDNGILVHHFWGDETIQPDSGISIVALGGSPKIIRKQMKLGNAMEVLPMRAFVMHPSPVTAWGGCATDESISAQSDTNDLVTGRRRHRRLQMRPKLAIDLNDGGTEADLRKDDAFYKCRLDRMPKPIHVPEQSLAEHAVALDFAMQHMKMAFSVPDITAGRTNDSDVTSGKAIGLLQTAAAEPMKLVGKQLNDGIGWVGQFVLAETQGKASGQRLVGIVGKDNKLEYRWWSRTDLQPSVYRHSPNDAANVVVTTFTNLPLTPQEAKQTALMFMQIEGAIPPEDLPQIASQVFGMNNIRGLSDRGRTATTNAENRVVLWRQGQLAQELSEADDFVIAIPIFERFVSGDEFNQLPEEVQTQAVQQLEQAQQGKWDKLADEEMRRDWARIRAASKYAEIARNAAGEGSSAALHFSAIAQGAGQGAVAAIAGVGQEPQAQPSPKRGQPATSAA